MYGRTEHVEETMAPPARTPRSEWIRHGLRALADGGPDAVRIDRLAKALGASRGSFYWHFEDRSALLAAMLDTWEQATTEEAVRRVESEGGDTTARLGRLLALTSPGVVKTDLAIRDWARRDPAVAERLRRIDNRRMAYLRTLFTGLSCSPAEVEARCLLTLSLLIGNHYIAADHGPYSRTDMVDLALRQLTARSGSGESPDPPDSAMRDRGQRRGTVRHREDPVRPTGD
jgi:AcrR family transcriptional regulator